jgi:hypothetical protein
VARPGFPSNYLRTFGLLGLLGVSAVATAVTASLAGAGNLLGVSGLPIKILAYALSTAIDIGLFFAAFRIATAKTIATRDLLLGAILSSIAWQILLSFAGGSSLPAISNTPKRSLASSVSSWACSPGSAYKPLRPCTPWKPTSSVPATSGPVASPNHP